MHTTHFPPLSHTHNHTTPRTQAWAVVERVPSLIGPACEQPEYNMFMRHKVEEEFQPLYKRCAQHTARQRMLSCCVLCVRLWRCVLAAAAPAPPPDRLCRPPCVCVCVCFCVCLLSCCLVVVSHGLGLTTWSPLASGVLTGAW
jgi:hypothetical protein